MAVAAVIFGYVLSFAWSILLPAAHVFGLIICAIFCIDVFKLFRYKTPVSASRSMAKLLSLGDENTITLKITNHCKSKFYAQIIDELPTQLQYRNFLIKAELKPTNVEKLTYTITPKERGKYAFGHVVVYVHTRINFASRRLNAATEYTASVYPSIIQMRKFSLFANPKYARVLGIKKIRKLGHNYEFDQIKNYVSGDDYRSLNWKATGRHNQLMVNQYQDERSQPVYFLIDKSRQMKLPFNNMALLDYAINTTLVLSNIALQKNDRVGLLTFANHTETFLKASSSGKQLSVLLEQLYAQQESHEEANFEFLYNTVRNRITTRSLLILFTNIESKHTLKRNLPLFKKLAKSHLFLVVVFENTNLTTYSNELAEDLIDVYLKSAAKQQSIEKKQLVLELQKHGIQTLYTKPENLSINTVNKYIAFKARGLI